MLTNLAVVCMSSLEWQFSWQPNQEIMYRLGEAGNRVLFVETTGVRSVRLRDWRRILSRIRTSLGVGSSLHKTQSNVTIYAPLVLPFPHSRLSHALNTRVIFRRIDTWRRAGTARDLVVWAFLPSPMTIAVIEHLQPSAVVFHYMGDAGASRPLPAVARAETELLHRSDLVFANSLPLLENARRFGSKAYLFRAGVDVRAFQRAADGAPRPKELDGMRGPIAGYVGSIHEWLDLKLLAEAAGRLPSWHFVMIGTIVRDVGSVRRFTNIHWFGPRPHQDLPQYINYFDVCMIPYILNEYTASAYPGKLNEYLALGKPVVATALPELAAFNREFGEVVFLSSTAASFARALVDAFEQSTDAAREQRLEAARANSWQAQLEAMSDLIAARIRESSLAART